MKMRALLLILILSPSFSAQSMYQCFRSLSVAMIISYNCVMCIVSVVPDVFTSVPGGSAIFSCSASTLGGGDSIIDIQWQLNNTSVEMLGLDSVADVFIPQTSTGILTFSSISQDLNMTSVTCLANLTSGHVVISERTAILLVQGI